MRTTRVIAVAALAVACAALVAGTGAAAKPKNVCPNGKVRFGVEPYDAGPQFTGAYQALTKALQTNLKCPVQLIVTNNYIAVFGTAERKPVTYTAAIWVPDASPIQHVADLKGHTIAFSDPASTSGNLFPRYALIKAGLNPDSDVTIQFAGSHSASLLALTNGKVDAAEVNSQQQATASAAGQFDTTKYKAIWRSKPIQNDPITVRG